MRPLRIVFFGTPQFAVPTLEALLASEHTVCGVVTQPDRPRGRGHKVTESPVKQVAIAHGIPCAQPDALRDRALEPVLQQWAPDLGVVVAYGQLLPRWLLALPPLGLVNVHASVLPKYRGAAPIHRAVIAGETHTGVTIMRVAPKLDAGATFAHAVVPIGDTDTSETLERVLADRGAALLVDVVARIADGRAVETPQDESLVTYAAKLSKDESPVEWSQPAPVIHNRIRGLQPWPHASSRLDGQRIILLESTVVPRETAPPGTAPGSVVAVTGDTVHVAAGDGGLIALKRLQPEGRRAMTVREYLAGTPIRPGQRFS